LTPCRESEETLTIVRGLFRASRKRLLLALAFTIGVGLTDGLSVLLLVPLLKAAGVAVEGSVGRISTILASSFNSVGLRPSLLSVLAVFVIVSLLQASLSWAATMTGTLAVHDYAQALRERLYTAITRADWLVLSRIRSSEFTFALTTAIDQAENGASNVMFLIGGLFVALVYTILALRVSVEMTATVIAAAFVLLMVERARALLGLKHGSAVVSTTRDLYATAAEQLGGLKTAKSYGQEERHLDLFLDIGRRVNAARLELTRSFVTLRWRSTVSSVIALSLILYIAVAVMHLPAAAILLLLFLFSRLVPRLVTLQQTYQEILGAVPAIDAIEGQIAQCRSGVSHDDIPQLPIDFRDSIELRAIAFSYDSSGSLSLNELDMQIFPGKTTAIVGSSGAGKSTVADLILGLLRAEHGSVLIDGIPLGSSQMKSWRALIGYVSQETFLFNDTVRFNLAWAQPGATEREMLDALESAAALDFVNRLPDGVDTTIGERGVRLSGGERQRLSLARALLRKPRILILDEATSSLDSENEQRIYDAIQKLHGSITIVLITHRLSTVRDADRIYVLDRGRVVAAGTWSELMTSENARFRELYGSQLL
jgi:ATP-binding cassette subfamily C protein